MIDMAQNTDYIVASDASVVAEVAADIGNARTVVLVRTAADPTPIAVELPSVRTLQPAFSWKLFADRGLPAASWSTLKRDEHVIERDGLERFLGRLAVEHGSAASSGRGSDARYYDGTTLEFILAGVAAALPSASKIAVVRLRTLIPIALWHLAPQVEQALRGVYAFRYNGRDVTVAIKQVTVRREAEAAFDALDGDVSGNVVLIDAGGRTVNVALFKDGTYRSGATLELGVQAALDNLDTYLIGQRFRALNLAERDELEVALIAEREYFYYHEGTFIRLDLFARTQLDATAAALVQELSAKVPIGQARRIVFVGGGAYDALFGATVKSLLPRCETSGLRALANAYGALGAVPVKRGKKK
jgi:hypothetical protein